MSAGKMVVSMPQAEDKSDKKKYISVVGQRSKRSVALQALYAIEQFEYYDSPEGFLDKFSAYGINPGSKDNNLARDVIVGCSKEKDFLDKKFIHLLKNWTSSRISLITKILLRMAIWEYFYSKDKTPANIIIFEYIELAKAYGENDCFKFINGILDRVFQESRD